MSQNLCMCSGPSYMANTTVGGQKSYLPNLTVYSFKGRRHLKNSRCTLEALGPALPPDISQNSF